MIRMSHMLRVLFALMCVLNFESCALVRQRQQQAGVTASTSESHATISRSFSLDTLAEQLNIVLDSVEHIRYDTLVNNIPSSMVKVKATKATINRQATESVTHEELYQASDTTTFSAVSEQLATETEQSTKGSTSTPHRAHPPNWMFVIAIAILSILLWSHIRK